MAFNNDGTEKPKTVGGNACGEHCFVFFLVLVVNGTLCGMNPFSDPLPCAPFISSPLFRTNCFLALLEMQK